MNYNGLPDCPNFGQLGQTPKLPIFPFSSRLTNLHLHLTFGACLIPIDCI